MTKGGSDKRPPKAVAPRGVRKIFNVRAFEMAQICLVFIAGFAYKDTKKYPFQKIYLLAELVHFFLTTRLLYIFTFSLGGSTEPPEPPLNPPQDMFLKNGLQQLVPWTKTVSLHVVVHILLYECFKP